MSSNGGLFEHEESALILIDYQPEIFEQVRSEPSENLIDLNVRLLICAAKVFDMPIILSTVGVKMGANHPTKKSIRSAIPPGLRRLASACRFHQLGGQTLTLIPAVTWQYQKYVIYPALRNRYCVVACDYRRPSGERSTARMNKGAAASL